MPKLRHFLLVFDHSAGRLIDERVFDDSDEAVAAYTAKERECAHHKMIEIVLIGSDSLETVRLTHANYFDGSVAVSKYFAGLDV